MAKVISVSSLLVTHSVKPFNPLGMDKNHVSIRVHSFGDILAILTPV